MVTDLRIIATCQNCGPVQSDLVYYYNKYRRHFKKYYEINIKFVCPKCKLELYTLDTTRFRALLNLNADNEEINLDEFMKE
jgi:hypothetical protein